MDDRKNEESPSPQQIQGASKTPEIGPKDREHNLHPQARDHRVPDNDDEDYSPPSCRVPWGHMIDSHGCSYEGPYYQAKECLDLERSSRSISEHGPFVAGAGSPAMHLREDPRLPTTSSSVADFDAAALPRSWDLSVPQLVSRLCVSNHIPTPGSRFFARPQQLNSILPADRTQSHLNANAALFVPGQKHPAEYDNESEGAGGDKPLARAQTQNVGLHAAAQDFVPTPQFAKVPYFHYEPPLEDAMSDNDLIPAVVDDDVWNSHLPASLSQAIINLGIKVPDNVQDSSQYQGHTKGLIEARDTLPSPDFVSNHISPADRIMVHQIRREGLLRWSQIGHDAQTNSNDAVAGPSSQTRQPHSQAQQSPQARDSDARGAVQQSDIIQDQSMVAPIEGNYDVAGRSRETRQSPSQTQRSPQAGGNGVASEFGVWEIDYSSTTAQRPFEAATGKPTQSVFEWLKFHRLHKYEEIFANMEWDEVLMVTDAQLLEHGVTKGARDKLLRLFGEITGGD